MLHCQGVGPESEDTPEVPNTLKLRHWTCIPLYLDHFRSATKREREEVTRFIRKCVLGYANSGVGGHILGGVSEDGEWKLTRLAATALSLSRSQPSRMVPLLKC